jgi:hypothetical protein
MADERLPAKEEWGVPHLFDKAIGARVLFFTKSGRIGSAVNGLSQITPGDKLLIIPSAEWVFCARPLQTQGHKTFTLVNQCWVEGRYDG